MNTFGIHDVEKAKAWHPDCEFIHIFAQNFHHFTTIYTLAGEDWKRGDTYLSFPNIYTYNLGNLRKQETLYKLGHSVSSCLMIGNRLYHSFLILLLSNPTLTIECLNTDDRIVTYLNIHFGDRIKKYSGAAQYDLVHFDIDIPGAADTLEKYIRCAGPRKYVMINEHKQIYPIVQSYIESGKLVWVSSCESAIVTSWNLHD